MRATDASVDAPSYTPLALRTAVPVSNITTIENGVGANARKLLFHEEILVNWNFGESCLQWFEQAKKFHNSMRVHE